MESQKKNYSFNIRHDLELELMMCVVYIFFEQHIMKYDFDQYFAVFAVRIETILKLSLK